MIQMEWSSPTLPAGASPAPGGRPRPMASPSPEAGPTPAASASTPGGSTSGSHRQQHELLAARGSFKTESPPRGRRERRRSLRRSARGDAGQSDPDCVGPVLTRGCPTCCHPRRRYVVRGPVPRSVLSTLVCRLASRLASGVAEQRQLCARGLERPRMLGAMGSTPTCCGERTARTSLYSFESKASEGRPSSHTRGALFPFISVICQRL